MDWPLQSQAMQFYGDPRGTSWFADNVVHVECPWPLHVGATPVHTIAIHKKCADSLRIVLANVWDAVNHDAGTIKTLRYDVYDGSYNFRPKRGSSSLSMHAFAAALDWDAADNAFHSAHHLFTDQSLLVVKFKEQGWIWGGDWSPGSIDAMHVQAARIHP